MATNVPVTGKTPITIKISCGDTVKKLKLPLKDLTADVLPSKLTALLGLPADKKIVYERFSDSFGGWNTLTPDNPAVYKTLVRAAKAKLKLRLKATVEGMETHATAAASQETASGAAPAKPTSSANERKNVGSGIFEFKDSRTSQQQKIKEFHTTSMGDAPLPRPFSIPCPPVTMQPLSLRPKHDISSLCGPTWSVYCNNCDVVMHNEHFHCSICDGGDFDLCPGCVDKGKLCPGQGHWLVKRFVQNGQMICSTTERLPPKARTKPEIAPGPMPDNSRLEPTLSALVNSVFGIPGHKPLASPPSYSSLAPAPVPIPGAFTDDVKSTQEAQLPLTRTCNCCVDVLSEHMFVTCSDCNDYDLCIACHSRNKHGHHPGHTLSVVSKDRVLNPYQQALTAPGRNVLHAAICDGCDKSIHGIRHKCFDCPDFDYCNDCHRSAIDSHPGHRFAPLYDPIVFINKAPVVHHGIYCDGEVCSSVAGQSYIQGVRYKCAVCHDRDYCASCEASPKNSHDKSHPMLKITMPIRSLEITTMNDVRKELGHKSVDAKPSAPVAKVSAPVSSASSVKTVAHIEPTPTTTESSKVTVETVELPTSKVTAVETVELPSAGELHAIFVSDTIPDGIVVRADTRFTQVWTMRNTGTKAWPAGCSVRFVGGDNMLNVDRERPCSTTTLNEATESNVIGREVQVGEEVAFKVVMKTPCRIGKAISYWRLKTADGISFGHRLWCDIDVQQQSTDTVSPKDDANSTASKLARVQQLAARHSERMRQLQSRQAEQQLRQNQLHKYVDSHARLHDVHKTLASTREQPWARGSNDFGTGAMSQQKRTDLDNAILARQTYFKRKMQEMNLARQELAAQNVVAGPATVEQVDVPKPQAVTADQNKTEENKTEENVGFSNLTGSQMVFPTLEKESPASSIHQSTYSKAKVAAVEDEITGDVITAEKPPVTTSASSSAASEFDSIKDENEEVFEDISSEMEILSAEDTISDDDDDDGFLTDEEYDILDASDDETVASL